MQYHRIFSPRSWRLCIALLSVSLSFGFCESCLDNSTTEESINVQDTATMTDAGAADGMTGSAPTTGADDMMGAPYSTDTTSMGTGNGDGYSGSWNHNDDGVSIPDTADYVEDTLRNTGTIGANKRKAELAYNFKPRMNRGGSQIIRAYVRFKGSSTQPIAAVMDTIIRDEEPGHGRADDTTRAYNRDIIVYRFLHVTLSDSTGKCKVVPEDPSRQKLDPIDGNVWRWLVTTESGDEQVELRMRVQAELPDGTLDRFKPVTIPIHIELSGVCRRILVYLQDNPAVLWSAIVGLVGFAGGIIMWWLKRKGGNSKEQAA